MTVETFTLQHAPAEARPDLLRGALSDLPMPVDLRLERTHDLSARFGRRLLGQVAVEVFDIDGAYGAAERRLSTANSDIAPQLTVHLLASGTVDLLQNGRAATPLAGEMVLSSTEHSFTTVQRGACHQRTFTVSYDDLGVDARLIRSALATTLGSGHPVAGVLAAHLAHVARLMFGPADAGQRGFGPADFGQRGFGPADFGQRGFGPADFGQRDGPDLDATTGPMGRSVVELMRALLLSRHWDETAAREPLQATLPQRIMHFVRAHATEPQLSAAQIANAHGISVRYLYVVLARHDVVLGDWVRQLRLERAARMLGEPGSITSVSAIAHECGFADHAHFARNFRSAYGVTPTQWRRQAQPWPVRRSRPEAR